MTSNSSAGGVAAVDRALTILNAFRTGDEGALTLATLASRTGLYKSTILRLLSSLERAGYIFQISDGRYKLGHVLYELGTRYRESFKLEEVVRPVLNSIVEEVNESCSYLVREGDYQLILYRCETRQRVRDHLMQGDTMLLKDGGASAKVFARFSDRHSANGSVAEICESSYGERHPEMAGIAVPIFAEFGEFAGVLSITGPLYRITREKGQAMSSMLTAKGRELSLALGAPDSLYS